jgi:glycosyltransferase involved in cell wall biosynthesis
MRLAIVRPGSGILSDTTYNVQELGLGRALVDQGIACDVFLAGDVDTAQTRTVCVLAGAELREVRLPVLGLPGKQGWFSDLRGLLESGDYDLVQTHEDSQVTSVRLSSWMHAKGVPVVLCQGMYEDYRGPVKSVLQATYDRTALPVLRRNCMAVTAKSEAAAAYCRRKGFRNVRVNPVGLDTSAFPPGDTDWRHLLDLPAGARILLYVGVLEDRRHPGLLLDVADELARRDSDVALIIVGSGPLGDWTKYEGSRRLGGAFRYLERAEQADLPALYRSATVTLMPSTYEIYGMSVLESMFFGTPVVASAVGGLVDLVAGGAGLLVTSCATQDWADAVQAIMDASPAELARTRSAARRRGEMLTWQVLGPRYAAFYRQIANLSLGQ